MKERFRFWMFVAVRLVVAMVIPLCFSHSQGFLDTRTIAYGMVWVYSDGIATSSWSVLAALVLSCPVVVYAVSVRRHLESNYVTKVGTEIAAILILLPLLGIAHPAAQDLTWQGSPYLFPSGFCMMLLLLFVILPAVPRLIGSQQSNVRPQLGVLAAVLLAVCLLCPFAFENYYGLLGFSERSLYWCLLRVVTGRWGLAGEVTFELTDSVGWSSALVTYQMATVLLIARLLSAGLFIEYLTHRVRLGVVIIGAVAQETFTLCAVVAAGTQVITDPYTVWTILPLPVVLPATLILVWLKARVDAKTRRTDDDGREYVTIPLSIRIRSVLMRRRRT